MQRSLRLAVFDCDGTLVDSQAGILSAMAAACAAEDLPAPDASAVRAVIGLPLAECVARLLPGEEEGRCRRVVDAYRAAFRGMREAGDHHEPLYPGTREALDALDGAGYLLGIATGKAMRGLSAVLERHNLAGRFVTLQTADRGPGKPHPDMLLRAMAETGAEPRHTIMIGDTTFDMLMARYARTAAIGVGWGYHAVEDLRGAGAQMVIERFADLPPALAGLAA